jgi:putative hydrolase of the HAD superfamily
MIMENISVIAFDGDDTLWVNEPLFEETEREFCALLSKYLPASAVSAALFENEMKNLELYGYGIKGFTLCMVETVCQLAEQSAGLNLIQDTLRLGRQLLQKPVVLLDGVEDVLKILNGHYRLVLATKGDLLDQERKLKNSGLAHYFHHIEVMSDKGIADYRKLLGHLDCRPEHFLMVGNSVRSDILPVLALEANAINIPFHTTWAHECHQDSDIDGKSFLKLSAITELLDYLPLQAAKRI